MFSAHASWALKASKDKVVGCSSDLQNEKLYHYKKRICSFHMQADVVYKYDEPGQWRFCFQCGKLEPLEEFDGKQRSCRDRLLQRRKPHKRNGTNLAGDSQQQQDQRPKRRTKRPSGAHRTPGHSSKSPDTENSAWEEQQAQLLDLMQWQYDCTQQQQQGAQPCLVSACGFGADSYLGDAPTSPAAAAAAAAEWQQQMGFGAAGTQDVGVLGPPDAGAAGTRALWQQPSLVSAWGFSADSCQGEGPAAAAAMQWQQQLGSSAAIQDLEVQAPAAAATATLRQQPSLASTWGFSADSCQADVPTSPAAAAALRWQQRVGSLAAGIKDAAACLTSLQRTNTAASAALVAPLLGGQVPAPNADPRPAASMAAAAGGGSCRVADLTSAEQISGHIAALNHQCEELQARIDSMETAAPAVDASRTAAAAAAAARSGNMLMAPAAGPARLEPHPPPVAPVLLPQQQEPVALERQHSWQSSTPPAGRAAEQRQRSWQNSTPSSLASGATAAAVAPTAVAPTAVAPTAVAPTAAAPTAVVPTASHMELVEKVMQQLEDSSTAAKAEKLEAMIERELRVAAQLPPEYARYSWATQINQMIDGISSAISSTCSAQPQLAAASAGRGRPMPVVPATTAAAAAVTTPKEILPIGPAGVVNKLQSPTSGVSAVAVVETMLDMRLTSLQQQLSQLQAMVHDLRGQHVVPA